MKPPYFRSVAMTLTLSAILGGSSFAQERVQVANGTLEGSIDPTTGIRSFKGIPFAQPPIGDLRWRAPQPVKDWQGVRRADRFGPRAMQRAIYSDMIFRSDGVSEDCLYLNVWTPAKAADERLPVLVYFFGGGYIAGDGSELRYDGESMARKGIVAVTVNYRLGIFGFLAHPELTAESPNHASGNYGLLDQSEALRWVKRNIGTFGGDPDRITIAGESAGSISVSAQMASPLSRGLIAGAIGESGSLMGALTPVPLAKAEQAGLRFATKINAKSVADLRKMPANELLQATASEAVGSFPLAIDGYFLPKDPVQIFAAGEQAHVPLLVGWNSEEGNARSVLGQQRPTREGFASAVRRLYGDRADAILKVYAAATDADVQQVATDLACDRFISYSTWKWADLHGKTGGKPVYRYYYARPRPAMRTQRGGAQPARGAVHSAEIEYALGNLATNRVYAWTADDYNLSQTMQNYFANFIKSGDANGAGLPSWPAANRAETVPVMHFDVNSRCEPEQHRERYLLLDEFMLK